MSLIEAINMIHLAVSQYINVIVANEKDCIRSNRVSKDMTRFMIFNLALCAVTIESHKNIGK